MSLALGQIWKKLRENTMKKFFVIGTLLVLVAGGIAGFGGYQLGASQEFRWETEFNNFDNVLVEIDKKQVSVRVHYVDTNTTQFWIGPRR